MATSEAKEAKEPDGYVVAAHDAKGEAVGQGIYQGQQAEEQGEGGLRMAKYIIKFLTGDAKHSDVSFMIEADSESEAVKKINDGKWQYETF